MAMQNLLLDGGARINEVKEMCEVDRVIVDTRKRTIRIVGRDAAEVSKARDMLEMAYETIENVPEMALRIIVGKGGSKVNDIKARTGAEISVNFDKQSVFIRGRPSQVKSAKVLVNSCIKTYEVEHVEVTYEDLDDVREELSRLQMEWGARPVQYVREGRGGRGGRGGLRMPAA
jgi:polyribonucleotide nucleotidyltransferase